MLDGVGQDTSNHLNLQHMLSRPLRVRFEVAFCRKGGGGRGDKRHMASESQKGVTLRKIPQGTLLSLQSFLVDIIPHLVPCCVQIHLQSSDLDKLLPLMKQPMTNRTT